MKLREQMMMTVGLSLLCTTQAYGQPAATAGGEEASQLEEIVVTAQKRSENMQQVPIAITAFSAEKLQERQVFSVGDIAQYTPNLNFSSAGGDPRPPRASIFAASASISRISPPIPRWASIWTTSIWRVRWVRISAWATSRRSMC